MRRFGAILILLSFWANQTGLARSEYKHADNARPINNSKAEKSKDGQQTVVEQQTVYSGESNQDGNNQKPQASDPAHDWIDKLNAFSTSIIALFTILLFFGVMFQIRTSRDIERAWIMTDLNWFEKTLHVTEHTNPGELRTRASVQLICKNDGKSPAWVDKIRGRMDIVNPTTIAEDPSTKSLSNFGGIGPIGAGQKRTTALQLSCFGHRKEEEFLSIYVIAEYRDIFGRRRTTKLGYSVTGSQLYRQDGLPERNTNT